MQRLRAARPSGFIEPRLPSIARKPPTGPQWLHEIKFDGYRILARRSGDRVRLFTRRGCDWSDRYPRIVAAMSALKVRSATLYGETVWCGEDGVSDFEKVHGHQVSLYAFDLLVLEGLDLREVPLIERKAKLAELVARAPDGIRYSEHLEGDGATIFEHVCKLGFEGIVSKRRDLPYISGRAKCWIKVRNPASAAMRRYEEGTF